MEMDAMYEQLGIEKKVLEFGKMCIRDSFVTGRLDNNTTVHFKGDASLIGQIVDVYLDESKGFYYMGTLK